MQSQFYLIRPNSYSPATDSPSIRLRFRFYEFHLCWALVTLFGFGFGFGFGFRFGFSLVSVGVFLRFHKATKTRNTNASLALFLLFAVDQNAIKIVRASGTAFLLIPYSLALLHSLSIGGATLFDCLDHKIVCCWLVKISIDGKWGKNRKRNIGRSWTFCGLLFMVSVCLGL